MTQSFKLLSLWSKVDRTILDWFGRHPPLFTVTVGVFLVSLTFVTEFAYRENRRAEYEAHAIELHWEQTLTEQEGEIEREHEKGAKHFRDPVTKKEIPTKEAVDKATEGKVLFDTPKKTRQGETSEVVVRIARSKSVDITKKLPPKNEALTDVLIVEGHMSVILDGDPWSKITPKMPEDQYVPENGLAEWRFGVKALEPGNHQLTLYVGFRTIVAGTADEYTFTESYERTVDVEVDRYYGFKEFWKENWKWIVAVIGAISTIIGIILKLKGKGSKKEDEKEPEEDDDDEE